MKYLRLFYVFFPKYYFLTLFAALLIRHYSDASFNISLANLFITLFFLLVFFKLAIIFHEIGHLLAAKIVKGKARRLVLGNGHEVAKFKLKNLRVVINSEFNNGYTYASFGDQSRVPWKSALYVSGGIITNFVLAWVTYLIFPINYSPAHINFALAFVLPNLYIGIKALIPYNITRLGMKLPSDGLHLLNIITGKWEKFRLQDQLDFFFEAENAIEDQDFEKAIHIYMECLQCSPSDLNVKLNLSVAYIRSGQFQEALKLLNEINDKMTENQFDNLRAIYLNNKAWLYILLNEADKADEYSRISFDLGFKECVFHGVRGAALIQNGKIDDGISLLLPLVNFNYPNKITLLAALFLCLGYFRQNNIEEQTRYYDFVCKNVDMMEPDYQAVWLRLNDEIAVGEESNISIQSSEDRS